MNTLVIMLKNVLIFVLLAVPGYLLVKKNMLNQKESGAMSKLLTNIGMPFMILSSTMKLEFSGEFTLSMILMAVVGSLFVGLMFISSAWFFAKDSDEKRRDMSRFCAVFANNGFIGIPLARAVFGEDSTVMAFLIVLNIINNVLMFTLGVYLISGDKNTINVKKAVLNPVLIAFLAGIALNLIGVPKAIPEVQTYATHFSGIVTPLSMVILGMKLAGVEMKKLFTSPWMYRMSAWRLVIYPAIGVVVMWLLSLIPFLSLGADAIIAFFVAFAMPTAGLASTFSDQYHGDTENAVIFTLGSTILSIATIPVLYWLLRLFV